MVKVIYTNQDLKGQYEKEIKRTNKELFEHNDEQAIHEMYLLYNDLAWNNFVANLKVFFQKLEARCYVKGLRYVDKGVLEQRQVLASFEELMRGCGLYDYDLISVLEDTDGLMIKGKNELSGSWDIYKFYKITKEGEDVLLQHSGEANTEPYASVLFDVLEQNEKALDTLSFLDIIER